MPDEIELKLRIAKADIAQLRRHPALTRHLVDKPRTRKLLSIYYDTTDLQLLDAAISLRVRRMSGRWFQAVKGAGHVVAGLHQRMEWEDIIASGHPDFAKITEPELARVFASQELRHALKPIFTTDVQRSEWQLKYADGSALEVALDVGSLQIGAAGNIRHAEPLVEIELELKQGHAHHIFELALALQGDIALHVENISKAQRGYVHYRPQPPAENPLDSLTLHVAATRAEAFRALAGRCLQQMHEHAALLAQQSTALEPMRTAVQRLMFVLKTFKRERDETSKELAWLQKLLGRARGWDRFMQRTLPAFEAVALPLPESLRSQAGAKQKHAWNRLQQALHSQRYQRLLLNLGADLVDDSWPAKPAQPLIERRLKRLRQKLRRNNLDSQAPSLQTLRKLRRQADHLRYGQALLMSQCKTPQADQAVFAQALSDWDQALAAMEDASLSKRMAKRWARDTELHSGPAVERLAQWSAEQALAARPQAATALQTLQALPATQAYGTDAAKR